MRFFFLLFPSLILTLWANAYAADAPVPANAKNVLLRESGGNSDKERDRLPSLVLTSQIVFRVLAAEIALQRNLFAPAYQTYLVLARETHDPRMAQRAAEIALYARSPSDALAAARIWRRDAPHSGRAARFEAKARLARALLARLKSSDPQIQVLIARIDSALLLTAQRNTEAEARLAQAYKVWPDMPDLIYDYAMAAEKNRHYARMEALLRQLIDLRPDEADAYNALGYSLADRGQQLNKAKGFIEKAFQLAPDNSYILDSLGWVKYRLGHIEEAAIWLQRAYQIEPHAEIGAHLGEVLWKLGRQEEARRIWRDTQRIEPDNAILRETIQRFLGQP